MTMIFCLPDLMIVAAAFFPGMFWWQARRKRMRRIFRDELLDHADLNRMVVSFNRPQILNARAAIATAIAGVLAGLWLSANMTLKVHA